MRDELLKAIKQVQTPGIGTSMELPFDTGGNALYLKNPKQIYVDTEQTTEEPLIQTLSGCNVYTQSTVVRVFFAVDAKNKPASYASAISMLKTLKDSVEFPGATSRTVSVDTLYEGDLLVSEIEYEFTRIT